MDRITVYKTLNSDYKSTYQEMVWPLPPNGTEPGPWLEIEGNPVLCRRGFHGWVNRDRAFKESKAYPSSQSSEGHVYEMEIEGNYLLDAEKVCGTRARLVREIFQQPQESWEEFVSREPSALEIVKAARKIREDISTENIGPIIGVKYGYHPVVPSFHDGPLKKSSKGPNCGTCGLNEQMHVGWEDRVRIAAQLKQFDMWELILYIQQILNGKDSGLNE